MKLTGPIIAAALFGVVVIGASVYQNWNPTSSTRTTQNTERTDTDTDADGVADWEENLLGLDPNNPDTDGDGVTDGVALAQARALLQGSTNDSTVSDANLTKTDILARELIGAYIQAKQFGEYDAQLFNDIVTVSAKNQFESTTPSYTASDLTRILPTKEGADAYVQSVRQALDPLTTIPEYELETFGRAVKEQNKQDFDTLLAHAALYNDTAKSLLEISVPNDAVETHLLLVNGLATFAHSLELLASSAEDPAQSFAAIKLFLESEEQVRAAFAGVSVYQVVHNEL